MRFKRHWTPRYLLDRVRLAIHERLHPDEPWLTPEAVRILDKLLPLPNDAALEWGSGRSTCWIAERVRKLTSVEADASWFKHVRATLDEKNIANVDYRHCPVADEEEHDSDYVRVCREFADDSLGFVLIDGAARATCAVRVAAKVRPGGLLVIDNIHRYLDYPTRSPASRFGAGPIHPLWREFESQVSGWRKIMTSSGVTDTAIWIRPSVPSSGNPRES